MTVTTFDPIALLRSALGARAFALADAPPDAELCALLQLGEAAAAEPKLAVALSAITTPRVRSLFQSQTSFRTTSGLRFSVDGGDIFAATLAAGYLPEAQDFETFMHLVRPGSVVVDVGANFGLYALSAALYARPHGQVFAFEPAPEAFALLARNIADNRLTVTASQAAVAAEAGRAHFFVGRDVSFSSLHRTKRIDDGAAEVEVEVVALDAALAQVRSIDLLKIDVEGGEGEVLRGAHAVLSRSRAPIVQFEYSHKNMNEARRPALEAAIARLADEGFRVFRRGVSGPASLPDPSEAYSGNLFLAREGESAQRLQRALRRTDRRPEAPGGLALLRRIAEQTEALQRAELLQREAIQVADSIVGDRVSGGSEAVRAMQQAWLDARKRALDAENQVNTLSASVQGRDRLVEQRTEKLAHLRSIILGLETRIGRLTEERDQLLEKVSSLRGSIEQLHQSLEQSRAMLTANDQRNLEKSASWREIETRLRKRAEDLKAALESANAKIETWREIEARLRTRAGALEAALKGEQDKVTAHAADNAHLRERLAELTSYKNTLEQKATRLEKICKRLEQRCLDLQAQLGAEAPAETDG